jgi:uncharacterized protein (DUF2147 family)
VYCGALVFQGTCLFNGQKMLNLSQDTLVVVIRVAIRRWVSTVLTDGRRDFVRMRAGSSAIVDVSAILLLATFSTSLLAVARTPTAEGLWKKFDPSGHPEAEFRIVDCDGFYQGKIAKIFPRPGENPSTLRCTECEGKQKNAPVLGLTFINGMRRDGLEYRDGTILDPRNGSVYDARMELSADGRTLSIRGYLGIPLLGQTEVWHRAAVAATPSDRSQSCSS